MVNAALELGVPMSLLLKVEKKLTFTLPHAYHAPISCSLFTVASLLCAMVTIYVICLLLLVSLGDDEIV